MIQDASGIELRAAQLRSLTMRLKITKVDQSVHRSLARFVPTLPTREPKRT